jgi:hypothetical protein
MNTYEVQVYENSDWKFSSYFDNRTEAVEQARRMLVGSHIIGVRVIQEDYDQDTNKATNSVVFSRLDKSDFLAKKSSAKIPSQKSKPLRDAHEYQISGTDQPPARKKGAILWLVLSLALVGAAGAAVWAGMQFKT